MRRYYYDSGITAPTRKRLPISTFNGVNLTVSEENLPINYSPKSYNFNMGKGVLEQGMGFNRAKLIVDGEPYILPECIVPLKSVHLYRQYVDGYGRKDMVVGFGNNTSMYYHYLNSTENWHVLPGVRVRGRYCCANYRYNNTDVFLVSSEVDGMYVVTDTYSLKVSSCPKITSMCTHYERVYATCAGEGNTLWFSDDYDPTNWNVSLSEGGYIELNDELGRINSVISFLGYVYLFRDYGINRLTAYVDQSDYTMSRLYLSVGKIIADTITVCGDRVIFQAEDGMYCFDGVDVTKIMCEIAPLFSSGQTASLGAYQGGKYYLACRLDMDSKLSGNNSIIQYDIYTGKLQIAHDIQVKSLLAVNIDNLCFVLTLLDKPTDFIGIIDSSGGVDGKPLSKVWCSPEMTLGINYGKKVLKEIIIRCLHNMMVFAVLDGKEYSYYASGGLNRIRVCREFDTIAIRLEANTAQAKVSQAELVVDIIAE